MPVATYADGVVIVALSLLGYLLAQEGIKKAMSTLFDRGIYGIDINKTTPEFRGKFREARRAETFPEEMKKYVVPESLGVVVGPVYLCTVALLLVYFSNQSISKMNAALSSIGFALLLGFVDDVLDVRWRYKVIFSAFGTLPLLASYDGATAIMIPPFLRAYLGGATYLEFGALYLVYMGMFCIFCTNSINILAGVNGVEVGQSMVIAAAQIIHSIVQIQRGDGAESSHMMAIVLLAPFLACSFALWQMNRYPSRVFVGDSYTYFAGMTLAVAGITGTYSKTLILFFAPQLFNFVISIPQLLKIVECPRHRVPKWNPKTDKLENSRNLTILNAILAVTGPLHEKTLTRATLLVQVLCCALAFVVRYKVAGAVFELVR